MITLTTQQRDVLLLLLHADAPLAATEIGQRVELKPRQVHYILGAVREWLARRGVALQNIPGVGAQVRCSPEQRQHLLDELRAYSRLQLVLSADQRQQILLFTMLTAAEPLVIQRLQETLTVSRSTVLKDMDATATWLARFDLDLVRRQHSGSWIEGPELATRQALTALLWGDMSSGRPIFAIQYGDGLTCALLSDADLLAALAPVRDLVEGCDFDTLIARVSWAEADLGWHFSDESVLYLALALFVQGWRIRVGRYVGCDPEMIAWLSGHAVWPTAEVLVSDYALDVLAIQSEIAAAAMLLLACPHEGGVAIPELHDMIEAALDQIALAYANDTLRADEPLRDGLRSQICTAALASRFGIWLPPRSSDDLPADEGDIERCLTDQIDDLFFAHTGARLADRHRHSLTLLLHAAATRARTSRARRVLVICPSGMATTQLLIARLRSRFPRHSSYEVVPLRQLGAAQIASADLIISTIPLSLDASTPVVQVHPSLTPADVAALDPWLD
ncbi:hypothetical protein EKD04_020930 [Chloroflexales bacterium ZM16-3]|nr:hypothetical protein [Chloroflexales bacterium ZM16-3]